MTKGGSEIPERHPEPLLAIKLGAVLPRRGIVPRARLVDRLAGCVRHRLTVVSAPAGAGKTTLLADWKASPAAQEQTVAWVSVDPADDDPFRFFRLVAAALRAATPGVGYGALALLRASPDASPDAIVATLLNDVAEPARDVVLVIDDYHHLRSRSIHDAIAFALGRLPPRLHLVLATRTSPPLPLARLRARGELLEIRAADLRFTVEEATSFLEGTAGLRLPPGTAEALAARTEGWGAGLQLAAISVEDRDTGGPHLATFTGSQRLVLDYFDDEVLRREPPEVQAFLMRTSILERLCEPLCHAVMGERSPRRARRRRTVTADDPGASQQILERLERENLFLVPLDEERRWWRYHRLFGEFLRRRLEDERRSETIELHRRAAVWLEENGCPAEAAHHAIEVRDFERAACLLEQAWRTGFVPTRPSVVLGWLRALPPTLMRSRPRLHLIEAWALVGTGQREAADACVREARIAAPRDRSIQAEADVLHGFGAAVRGEAPHAIELSNRALRRLPRGHAAPLAFVHLSLGLAHESLGNIDLASDDYGRARALEDPGRTGGSRSAWCPSSPRSSGVGRGPGGVAPFLASVRLGDIELARGSLRAAARLYEDAVHLASSLGDGAPCAGWPQWGLARVCYQWNDLESATRQLGDAVELGSRSDFGDDVSVVAYLQLAHVRQSQGDPRAARHLAARSEELIGSGRVSLPALLACAEALQIRLRLRQGDLDAAARWSESHGKSSAGATRGSRHEGNATWVRVMLAMDRANVVTEPLQRWLRSARSSGQTGQALELEMLWALALGALGQTKAACAALDRALTDAQVEGWIRILLDEGEPMARLLEHASRRRSATSAYARGVFAAFASGQGRVVQPRTTGFRHGESLIEPLGRREREILSLIADGFSNAEIAKRLLVTVATVKTHINNLYGKLGARSRTDAVARARRLGIV